MALASLRVYREAVADGAPDVRAELLDGPDPFTPDGLIEVRDVEGSKELDHRATPKIIVSASGMATGGRVLHHLARYLPDHRSSVVLVGFQAAGTRGRALAEGARQVKLLGHYVPVRAEVVDLPSFSVHADHDELMGWLGTAGREPSAVYVVHGEPEGSAALVDALAERSRLGRRRPGLPRTRHPPLSVAGSERRSGLVALGMGPMVHGGPGLLRDTPAPGPRRTSSSVGGSSVAASSTGMAPVSP